MPLSPRDARRVTEPLGSREVRVVGPAGDALHRLVGAILFGRQATHFIFSARRERVARKRSRASSSSSPFAVVVVVTTTQCQDSTDAEMETHTRAHTHRGRRAGSFGCDDVLSPSPLLWRQKKGLQQQKLSRDDDFIRFCDEWKYRHRQTGKRACQVSSSALARALAPPSFLHYVPRALERGARVVTSPLTRQKQQQQQHTPEAHTWEAPRENPRVPWGCLPQPPSRWVSQPPPPALTDLRTSSPRRVQP